MKSVENWSSGGLSQVTRVLHVKKTLLSFLLFPTWRRPLTLATLAVHVE